MPNHVTHKIIFELEKLQEVLDAVCPDGKFDFNCLIPQPNQIYLGDLSSEDKKDFPHNWLSWNRENWGTKWGGYSQSYGEENGKAFIKFDTAWTIPYPIISAFANRFNMPFEHHYFDEGHNYWGIEKWGTNEHSNVLHRLSKQWSLLDDEIPLCIELKGYDPRDKESEE